MKPNLRIVKLADIVPLMEYESAKVDYLISSFEQTGTIRNPFALASVSKSRYLMLENSSPLEAARRIKIEHIPAQVIPFKGFEIHRRSGRERCFAGRPEAFFGHVPPIFLRRRKNM